ncbi:hypothetical protein CAI16_10175 [Virgibacillus dokdonensis]|uniref:Uncharacterized protein n=1 Tax=Virgibacillus dokdonensis TaxID=302167 RepID=A0A3E0WP42_9BACI|nr:hypothetical protein [Virgibacillus dokdonensis]RFA34744.1 hypothetical protein CAI16_10175 [Virgibacillus dokdonensis]
MKNSLKSMKGLIGENGIKCYNNIIVVLARWVTKNLRDKMEMRLVITGDIANVIIGFASLTLTFLMGCNYDHGKNPL